MTAQVAGSGMPARGGDGEDGGDTGGDVGDVGGDTGGGVGFCAQQTASPGGDTGAVGGMAPGPGSPGNVPKTGLLLISERLASCRRSLAGGGAE